MKIVREIRLWLPWAILVFVIWKCYIVINQLREKLIFAKKEVVIVEKEIPIPQVVERVKWIEKIKYKEATPETIVIDTATHRYDRPWSIYELGKNGRRLNFIAGRSMGEGLMVFREYKYKLRTGEEFNIYPGADSMSPFFIKETRDLFSGDANIGWSFRDGFFAEGNGWLNRAIVNDNVDIGVGVIVSFRHSDLQLKLRLK